MSETNRAAMSETAVERRLREIGGARLVAQRLRRARARVGCDEVEDRDDAPCWKGSSEPNRCASCDATLVLSHALDRVREDERKARRSLNRIAERAALLERCEGEKP